MLGPALAIGSLMVGVTIIAAVAWVIAGPFVLRSDLRVIERIMDLEEEHGISVPDEDNAKIRTVAGANRYIANRKRRP